MTAENDPDDLSMLPADPRPEDLLDAYQLCRQKLVKANRSRSALNGHDKRRRAQIQELQQQLIDLENSLLQEAESRRRVHALNQRVGEIIREFEVGLDATAAIVEEKGERGLTTWVVRIARLLPVVLNLRDVRARAARLLGGGVDPKSALQPEPEPDPLPPAASEDASTLIPAPPPASSPPHPPPQLRLPQQAPTRGLRSRPPAVPFHGPLLLTDLGYAYGLLLLAPNPGAVPDGLRLDRESAWLPGQSLLVPEEPEDADFAPIEAAIQSILSDHACVPELAPWLERGVLPFATDPDLQLPRLIPLAQIETATHVLVRQELATGLADSGAVALPLDVDDDRWLGFGLAGADALEVLRHLLRTGQGPMRVLPPRLAARGGVRMADGQGYLATGLGLPLLSVPLGLETTFVALELADGSSLSYELAAENDLAVLRQLWQPCRQDRRRTEVVQGPACFSAIQANGQVLQRAIQLAGLPTRICFRRCVPLEFREDWGMDLGPLMMPELPSPAMVPDADAIQWARTRLNQGDHSVNHLFEQQMLESLSALFQRRSSILRREFFQLYAELRNKPDEWPGFPEAVLRGWCEGGWIEEGLERGNGRWRIQPVDPRLVRRHPTDAQLVGLLTSRGLVEVLALARQLGVMVKAVPPACADMPRGWRFQGDVEALARACALPLVDQQQWVPDPGGHGWMIEDPLPSDSPPWPTGLNARQTNDEVCGRRGLDQHWKPARPFPERGRAPINLSITMETSRYRKRRWHSHDPVTGAVFSSCHRNRVALHALIVATDGWWPFGFTDREIGQIDRLYDADAYLPLPIGRHAALSGSRMPGPTRHQPSDHTYRYHVAPGFRSLQTRTRELPLTDPP